MTSNHSSESDPTIGSSPPGDETATTRDGDVRDAEAFEVYLQTGGEAPAEFDSLRRMLQVVNEMGSVQAPEDFYEQVTRKLRRRRLWSAEGAAASLVSMPFQVVSVVAILIVAALYLLAEIDREHARLEPDSTSVRQPTPTESERAP